MDAEVVRFGTEARRLFRVAAMAQRWLPQAARPWAARMVGRRFSPFRDRRAQFVASLEQALDLSPVQADRVWTESLTSQALFAMTVFDYGRLSRRWLDRAVSVDDAQRLADIVQGGGFVISAHTHHHNTLGCVLGLSGARTSMLVAPSRSTPYYEWIGADIERINTGSERHFGGGTYIFTDEPARALAETQRRLADGQVVVSMCDAPRADGAPHLARARFLGKLVCPSAGGLDLAVRAGVPIHVAFLFPEAGKLRLHTARLQDSSSTALVLQRYFDALSSTVQAHPAAWQGWDWYHTLPEPD